MGGWLLVVVFFRDMVFKDRAGSDDFPEYFGMGTWGNLRFVLCKPSTRRLHAPPLKGKLDPVESNSGRKNVQAEVGMF